MKVRLPLLIILTLIGVVSGAKLLIQRYDLFTEKDIPVISDPKEKTTERETILNSGQADNQHPSEQLSTSQVKLGQSKKIKHTSARRKDKIVKAEANSKIVDFTQPAVDYIKSIEEFRLAVETAEVAVKDLEKINY